MLLLRTGAGVLGTLLLSICISRLVYPFDTGHFEAFSWTPAAHLLEGNNPYSYSSTPPYSMTPYGIVYYACVALGMVLFGPQMWFGRLLTVIAFAVCVWAVISITKRVADSLAARWFGCLISLALFPAQAWVAAMRSDLIAVALGFGAVALVVAADEAKRIARPRLLAAVLLVTGAFFTKHTVVLPIGIIALRFLQLARWRDAVLFSSATAVLVGGGIFLLDYSSGGGYLWQHLTHAQTLPFLFVQMRQVLWSVVSAPASIVLVIAGAFIVCTKIASGDRPEFFPSLRSPTLLLLVYFLLAFAASTVSAGRVGSNVNYYLEASFVAAVLGALIYEEFVRTEWRRIAAGFAVLMAFGGVIQMIRLQRGEYFRWKARSYYREISETVARHTPPGSVCVSVYAELVVRNGCTLYFDDFGEYTERWSPELGAFFEKEVRERRFAAIVWNKDESEKRFPGYRMVPMTQAPPERHFPVFLYVRVDEAG